MNDTKKEKAHFYINIYLNFLRNSGKSIIRTYCLCPKKTSEPLTNNYDNIKYLIWCAGVAKITVFVIDL